MPAGDELWRRLRRVFHRRRAAYAAFTQSPDGRVVLADLARFCRYRESTYSPDDPPEAMRHLEGRREVLLRILSHGDISDDEIDRIIEEETAR
ncbi:MAG: hypothetical protein GY791_08285 [Alphaproteobacteria bacterium]|nr:hypothetical protein [Alphaproteobacteria bacterium]